MEEQVRILSRINPCGVTPNQDADKANQDEEEPPRKRARFT